MAERRARDWKVPDRSDGKVSSPVSAFCADSWSDYKYIVITFCSSKIGGGDSSVVRAPDS